MDAPDHVTRVIDELLHFPEVLDRLIFVVDLFDESIRLEPAALCHRVELQIGNQEELPQHLVCGKGRMREEHSQEQIHTYLEVLEYRPARPGRDLRRQA